jgi:hypothetical protein
VKEGFGSIVSAFARSKEIYIYRQRFLAHSRVTIVATRFLAPIKAQSVPRCIGGWPEPPIRLATEAFSYQPVHLLYHL